MWGNFLSEIVQNGFSHTDIERALDDAEIKTHRANSRSKKCTGDVSHTEDAALVTNGKCPKERFAADSDGVLESQEASFSRGVLET